MPSSRLWCRQEREAPKKHRLHTPAKFRTGNCFVATTQATCKETCCLEAVDADQFSSSIVVGCPGRFSWGSDLECQGPRWHSCQTGDVCAAPRTTGGVGESGPKRRWQRATSFLAAPSGRRRYFLIYSLLSYDTCGGGSAEPPDAQIEPETDQC